MSRRFFIALPIILSILLIYIFIQQASAQTAVSQEQYPAVPSLQPIIRTASDDGRAKLHPQLLKALETAALDDTLNIMVSANPENGVSRLMTQVLIRPRLDPAGRQVIIGTVQAGLVLKIAADPAVHTVQLADNPIQPPHDSEIVFNDAALSLEAQQERIELMRSLEQNVRSIPPGREDLGRGWWDIGEGHRSAEAWANGFTGSGVKVLANDTGIDFCHPDLIGTWAIISDTNSPYNGWPQMFDSYSMYLYAQDTHLSTNYVGSGLADYADTSATCSLGSCVYQPIGAAASHTYSLPATSQSGVYHIGSHPDNSLQNIYGERVAVLVVDEMTAGIYDHVYVDLDDDYDFTDETAADQQMPAACLDNWDSAGGAPGADGYNDMSGGLVYFIADGVNPIPASDWLWGGLTPGNGELVAFSIVDQTQSGGSHGQFVVSNIVAQGVINGNAPAVKPLYAGPGTGMVSGGGLNAKVVSNGNFYMSPFLDDVFLFAALGYDGMAGTADDVQIISNSWADSTVHNEGWDEAGRLIEEALRLNPELTAIFSTGNGGPGYGTVVSPVPPGSLSVGSSTQFDTIGAFDSISTTNQINWGDVIPFSNRGPGAQGTNSVDITANGAVGSGDRPLHNTLNGWTAWTGWIGTSRSVPVAAGNLALVYDAYRQVHGVWPNTQAAQAILMSGADDQHNDLFVQGAGSVNALTATNIAGGLEGFYIMPSSWTAGDYRGENYPGFANILHPGQSGSGVFSLTNTGPSPISVTLSSDQLVLSETITFTFTTQPWNTEDTSSAFRPDYVIDISNQIPAGTDLMEVRLVYPFSQFDPELNYGFNQRYRFQALNWTDLNSDTNLWTDDNGNQVVNWGEIDVYEYMRLAYDYNTSNTHQLRIRRPLEQMEDGIFLALRHISRSGTVPTTTMRIEMNFYRHMPWDWLTFEDDSLTIGAGGTAVFSATMSIPADAGYGLYNGSIRVSGPNQQTIVPVVANVASNSNTFTVGGGSTAEAGGNITPYINDELYGNTNWAYRNESGDWRFFFMDAQLEPGTVSSLLVHNQWPGPVPNDIDTLIFGPTPDTYSENDPDYYGPYTLGAVGGSVNDYIGSGRYRFNTVTGTTEEWVSTPLEEGLHLIAQHNVLFAGPDTSLPFTKTAGTLSVSPGPVVIPACGPNGTTPITLTNSIALDGVTGAAFGLGMTEVYTNQQAFQDPSSPATAGFTQTLTITDGGRLSIEMGAAANSPFPTDLDLYLLHDANMSGTFDWPGEVIAFSNSPGTDERIRVDFPADGDYMIAVHGAQVPEPPILFDLTIEAVQGTELSLSGLPVGPVPAGSDSILNLAWNKTVLPGEIWKGMVVIGAIYLPSALTVPVYVLPCDPTGIIPEAAFSHNGPVVLGETAVFTNSSSGDPPLTYLWDFGDGSTTNEENPTHNYAAEGSYTVTLTTTNYLGSDVYSDVILVGEAAEAGFVHNGPVYVWETAIFTNTSTGSAPLSYLWDFGDGTMSTAEHPSHQYTAPGVYTVTLTVTNTLGSDVFTATIEVWEAMLFMPAVHKP